MAVAAAGRGSALPLIRVLPFDTFPKAKSDDILAYHRERGIEPRRGCGWHDDEQYYVRFSNRHDIWMRAQIRMIGGNGRPCHRK